MLSYCITQINNILSPFFTYIYVKAQRGDGVYLSHELPFSFSIGKIKLMGDEQESKILIFKKKKENSS